VQMSLLQINKGLAADKAFLDLLEKIIDGKEKVNKTDGLVYYTSSNRISGSVRQGKTTVISGLNSIQLFQENHRWAGVLAGQGIGFLFLDNPGIIFNEDSLSEKGKEWLKALNSAGLLLMIKNSSETEVKILLRESKKPVVFLSAEVPGKEILDLVKENSGAIGLLLQAEESPGGYFQKLDLLKKEIGTGHLMIVNEACLWGEAGRNQMLQLLSRLLEAKYERGDLANIFSRTLLRVLRKTRGEGDQTVRPPHPF
ncbi:MAG: hypothetical protein ACOC57_08155, partial [Acidobacteriota bacterium]